MTITLDKSVPEDADMLGQIQAGGEVTITGKVVTADDNEVTVDVESVTPVESTAQQSTNNPEDAKSGEPLAGGGENMEPDADETGAGDEPPGPEEQTPPMRKPKSRAVAIIMGNGGSKY